MSFTVDCRNYDLSKTLKSGQMFRYQELDESYFEVISLDKVCRVWQTTTDYVEVEPLCGKPGDAKYWRNYFDFDKNYSSLLEKMSQNTFLSEVAEYNSGLHLLKQDAWECLISFICSQQKRIPQIMVCVDKLCRSAGRYLGYDRYAFPSADELCSTNIGPAKLGYRESYVLGCAEEVRSKRFNINSLYPNKTTYRNARAELCRLPGVGAKVADCVALFGLHYDDAFPVDVHIAKICALPEMSGVNIAEFGKDSGILQQYLFNYAINHGI